MQANNIITKLTKPKTLLKILLIAVLTSNCLISGMFARFSSSGADADTARVAKFATISISETSDVYNDILPGSEFDHQVYVTVNGNAETAYETTVQIKIPTYERDGSKEELFSFQIAPEWTFCGKENSGSFVVYTYRSGNPKVQGTLPVFAGSIQVSPYSTEMPDAADIVVTASIEQIE